MRKLLTRITKNRPCKTIEINKEPYLKRYFMFSFFGYQVWLHQFLRNDSERHLHTHPWNAVSVILCGWYKELVLIENWPRARIKNAGDINRISCNHCHRIEAVESNTWTLMLVGRSRRKTWEFIGDDGTSTSMQSSPRDWYLAKDVA